MILATVILLFAIFCLGGMYAGVQIEKEARGFRVGGAE